MTERMPTRTEDNRYDSGVRYPSDFTEEEIARIRPLVVELIASGEWTAESLEDEKKYHDLLRYTNDIDTPGKTAFLFKSPDFQPEPLAQTQESTPQQVKTAITDTSKRLVSAIVEKK